MGGGGKEGRGESEPREGESEGRGWVYPRLSVSQDHQESCRRVHLPWDIA